jgi:hypothetical protein
MKQSRRNVSKEMYHVVEDYSTFSTIQGIAAHRRPGRG